MTNKILLNTTVLSLIKDRAGLEVHRSGRGWTALPGPPRSSRGAGGRALQSQGSRFLPKSNTDAKLSVLVPEHVQSPGTSPREKAARQPQRAKAALSKHRPST